MNWRRRLLTMLAAGGILTAAQAESGAVSGDKPHVDVPFTNAVSDSYILSAYPVDGWVFTEEFNYPESNGWYLVAPGSYTIMCEYIDGVDTAFVDAATIFPATISGQMYKPSEEPGGTIGWSVTGTANVMVGQAVDPAEKVLPFGGGSRAFRYLVNGELAPGGFWKYRGTAMAPNPPPEMDWQKAGASYALPADVEAGSYTLTAARNTAGALSADASVTVVKVKSVAAGEVVSTTNEADKIPVLYVEKKEKGTLTITATPEPGAEWPVDGETKYPIWSGSGGAVDSKDPAKYVLALDTAGSYTISASCGNTVSVKVVVIDIIIKEGGTVVSDGESHTRVAGQQIDLTAEILPENLKIKSQEWTIPGTRIKDYTESADEGKVIDINAADLKKSSIAYYWVDGSSSRDVTFSISIDIGNNQVFEKEVTAKYSVECPSAVLSAVAGEVKISDFGKGPELALGSPNASGVYFYKTVEPVATFSGKSIFRQKVNTFQRRYSRLWVDGKTYWYSKNAQNALDRTLNYGEGYRVEDSPGGVIPSEANLYSCSDSYTMWVMFKPTVSKGKTIWIPLASLSWSWSATAVKSSDGWATSSLSVKVPGAGKSTTTFPEWNKDIAPIHDGPYTLEIN